MAMVPRLTRILYFLPMLFITFVMSSMFAFDDGMVAHVVPKKDTTKDEECTPLYFTEVCDSSMLRSEFSKRRCCEQNCIANLLKMPLDVSVTPCCPSHSQYCLPTSSSSRSSDLQYFSETVAINRAAIQIKRVTKEDIRNNDEQYIVEKKARWRKHWVDYFIDHKKPGSNGTARFNWKYEISVVKGSRLIYDPRMHYLMQIPMVDVTFFPLCYVNHVGLLLMQSTTPMD